MDVLTDVHHLHDVFSKIHPTNYAIDNDNSITIKVDGTIKLIFSDDGYPRYELELCEKQSKPNSIESLESLSGLHIFERKIINDGKQVQCLLKQKSTTLPFSCLERIKKDFNPIDMWINVDYDTNECNIGLIFDLVNDNN